MPTDLRVHTYRLPRRYRWADRSDGRLISQSYQALRRFFADCAGTDDPAEADFHFVPLDPIQYQVRNGNPRGVLFHLDRLSERRDHLLVAGGDFSQRSKRNHQGEHYRETWDWLEPFILLAHESTGDLIPGQDIGIVPWNTLSDEPSFNRNERPLLYSFLGQINHTFLGPEHVRTRFGGLRTRQPDAFIGDSLDEELRDGLSRGYAAGDDHELVARNSVFTLAPAGYGRWTYRFFQAIQWGSIPVLLSDDYVKPFSDEIRYDEFTLTVPERELDDLDSMLRAISAAEIERLQRNLERNQAEFTKRAFLGRLVARLERMRNARG